MENERKRDQRKVQLIARAKQAFVIASLQELLQKMTQKCFKKCIDKPGISLDAAEKKCISMCMDRFMDSWILISQTFSNRVKTEAKLLENPLDDSTNDKHSTEL